MVRDGRAYKYAQWAVSETEGMVPHYVKVQAQQWMDIVDDYNEDAYVDEKEFEKICNLLKLMILIHTFIAAFMMQWKIMPGY